MFIKSRFEQDEIIGITALFIMTAVALVSLWHMWQSERHESKQMREERDSLFVSLAKRA